MQKSGLEQVDKSNMRKCIEDFPYHIQDAVRRAENIKINEKCSEIILLGMGGSAIAGDLLQAYCPQLRITVNRDYDLPHYCTKETLVIVSTYSGNTEETISAYKQAIRKKCTLVTITSNGRALELTRLNNNPVIILPQGMQPRAALAYSFFTLLKFLDNSGIIPPQTEQIQYAIKELKRPVFEQMGKELAAKLYKKIPLIYASKRLYSVAVRWKNQCNENAKMHAFCNQFSELDHNEIVGFVKKSDAFHVVMLRDEEESDPMQKRMKITKDLIREHDGDVTEIVIKGKNVLVRLSSAVLMGDWMSYYLALANGVDPSDVHIIEELKKRMK